MIAAVLFKRIALAVVAIVTVLLVALAAVGVANLAGFNPFQNQQIDRSQPALLESITNLSEYHAAEGNIQLIVDEEDDVKGLPAVIAGRRTLFVAAGTVSAYVDLSGLAKGDLTLSADGTAATVRLPDAQLDKPNLDQERTYLASQDRGVLDILNDVLKPADQSRFYKLAETKLAAAAEESDLRDRATANTKAMLTGMFGALGIKATFVGGAPE